MLIQSLEAALAIVPNPPPAAPAEVSARAATVIGFAKWASIISALIVLAGSGVMLFAGERNMGGGLSPELKSKLGQVVVVLLIAGASTQIVQFFL